VDDVRVPELAGAARVTFVRSPLGHARITGIDASAALAAPGVTAVLTAADIDDLPPPPPPPEGPPNEAAPVPMGGVWQEPLLAVDRVRFVGEPVAMVITDDAYAGADAAELVSVDYEPLPAVVGAQAALAGESLLFPGAGSNIALTAGSPADPAAFDGCEVVVERVISNQRVAPVPMEGRAVAARWADGRLTVWVSTQNA
jgi:carbon-monoxide dehydrogenase large subunit